MSDKPFERQSSANFPNRLLESRGSASNVQSLGSYDTDSEVRGGEYGQQNMSPAASGYPGLSTQQLHHGRSETLNLGALGTALPDVSYHNYSHTPSQRYQSNPSAQMMYQVHNVPHFTNPQTMGQGMPYTTQYQAQYGGIYASGQNPSSTTLQSGGSHAFHGQGQGQGYMGPQQSGAQYFVPQGQYNVQSHMYAGGMPAQYAMRGALPAEHRLQTQPRASDYGPNLGSGAQIRPTGNAPGTSQPSIVRGPPRKPRQSGHAIWIGNLPPQTDLMSLVLHVCKETTGLESLFLISKSNCAFANFKDEDTCTKAQMKIHDSRFQTVRLVSRLRRNSAGVSPGITVPTGPASSAAAAATTSTQAPNLNVDDTGKQVAIEAGASASREAEDPSSPKDKFFVVKSLTVEDLELSVRNGIWATQSHNEEILNKAYQTADNVFLIFSANKSGEYFGYAKMVSPINDDPAAAIEFAPKAHTVEDPELPRAIPTPATEFAPKGRIIDDSARGTIFWEVERDEEDEQEEGDDDSGSNAEEPASPSKAWGKPFQVEWISTNRLPFYRTRGLRNPWNSNREVKIARDGTELETAIGRRLLGLFHRLPSPVAPSTAQVGVFPMIEGYQQTRPF